MKNKKRTLSLFFILLLSVIGNLYATTLFSGFAGGKLNFGANSEAPKYDPDLTLQAFFAGQFNFSQNMWSHIEVSIDTQDLISKQIFHETPSILQIDELSWILRSNLEESTNYFSVYMGTYDPIGSDVFLQRYFGIEPISSKLTNSYLGLAGSILYPHFGFGISDVVRFYNNPIAVGGYAYLNHEDNKYFVFNTDFRFACVLRYFTCDIAGGLGAPIAKEEYEDLIVAINKLYWHMGATMLIGNNYTTSLFIQAGLYNASFTGKKDSFEWSPEKIYILLEPRFAIKNFHLNLSIYSLPKDTVKKLLFVDDSLGFDTNFYSDNIVIGSHTFTMGSHFSFSVKNKTLKDLADISNFMSDGFNINLTPYVTTDFLSGEVHAQANVKFMEFKNSIGKAFSFDLGYRTRF